MIAPAPDDTPFNALPIASVVVTADARATAVNDVWESVTKLARAQSIGTGWLAAIEPSHRSLAVARLSAAAALGERGRADWQLDGAAGGHWTRWWWRPNGDGELVVCVADINDDKALEGHLWHRATHDPLTQLINRTEFLSRVDRALDRQRRAPTATVVIFIDLNGFKAVNDKCGHRAGDEVLRTVAQRLRSAVRPADTVARVGGDEFAILCEGLTHADEATVVAERLEKSVGQPIDTTGHTWSITLSIGIALVRGPDGTAEDALARADAAMYAARSENAGRAGADYRLSAGARVHGTRAAIEGALDALGVAHSLLNGAWIEISSDTDVAPEASDHLLEAARLAQRAIQTLTPETKT